MRHKINTESNPATQAGYSDLYKRFRRIFDVLLNSTNPGHERQEFDEWYVENPTLEPELEYILFKNTTDVIRFFIGHTGIGKSTVLNHVCKGDKSEFDRSRRAYLIRLACNPTLITSDEIWHKWLCSAIEGAAAAIGPEASAGITPEAMADFINENRQDLLFRPEMPTDATVMDRADALRKADRRAYALEWLKLAALHVTEIEHLVLVLDDIESLPSSLQAQAVAEMLHTYKCLQNNLNRRYRLSLLIVMRPDTYRVLCREQTSTAYAFDEILFDMPVDLYRLFDVRFQTAQTKQDLMLIGNSAEWARSFDILKNLSREVRHGFGEEIVRLANYNVRESLRWFLRMLQNRKWFQKDANPQAAFRLEEFDYATNDAAMIKALAMPRYDMYFDNEEVLVANLLHNTQRPASDLAVSYIVRYYSAQTQGDGRKFGGYVLDLKELLERLEDLFPGYAGIHDHFEYAIGWMARRGLLWQSKEDTMLYSITPRAMQLWQFLEENTVLLQCYREDCYREVRAPNPDVYVHGGPRGSTAIALVASSKLKPEDLFLDCIAMTDEVRDHEHADLTAAQRDRRLRAPP